MCKTSKKLFQNFQKPFQLGGTFQNFNTHRRICFPANLSFLVSSCIYRGCDECTCMTKLQFKIMLIRGISICCFFVYFNCVAWFVYISFVQVMNAYIKLALPDDGQWQFLPSEVLEKIMLKGYSRSKSSKLSDRERKSAMPFKRVSMLYY